MTGCFQYSAHKKKKKKRKIEPRYNFSHTDSLAQRTGSAQGHTDWCTRSTYHSQPLTSACQTISYATSRLYLDSPALVIAIRVHIESLDTVPVHYQYVLGSTRLQTFWARPPRETWLQGRLDILVAPITRVRRGDHCHLGSRPLVLICLWIRDIKPRHVDGNFIF